MKRIFIVFSLLLALGISAPMANAADSFDANKSLSDNLAELAKATKTHIIPKGSFSGTTTFDVSVIYANAAVQLLYNSNVKEKSGFSMVENVAVDGTADSMLANFFNSFDHFVVDTKLFMSAGGKSMAYEWNGELLELKGGTVFMGLSLGLSNAEAIDLVFAIKPYKPAQTPVPAAVWLLGSGIAGLAVLRRKSA